MKQQALEILELVKRGASKREDRLTDLLRDPETDRLTDWYMHLPQHFNDALDIRQTSRQVGGKAVTVWTQGAGFAFKAGDTIYDTARAYDEWAQAVLHIKLCIQVISATAATSQRTSADRGAGSVAFNVLVPNSDRNRLIPSATYSLTQDEFVRLLISGDGLPQ